MWHLEGYVTGLLRHTITNLICVVPFDVVIKNHETVLKGAHSP